MDDNARMTMSPSALSLHAPLSSPNSPTPHLDYTAFIDGDIPPCKHPYRIKLVKAITESRVQEQEERRTLKAAHTQRVNNRQPPATQPGFRARTFETAASRRREKAQKKIYNTGERVNAQQITNSYGVDGGDSLVNEPGKSYGKWRLDEEEFVSGMGTSAYTTGPATGLGGSGHVGGYVRPRSNVGSKAVVHETLMQHSTPVRMRPKEAPRGRDVSGKARVVQQQRMKGMLNPVNETAVAGTKGDQPLPGMALSGSGIKSPGGRSKERPKSAVGRPKSAVGSPKSAVNRPKSAVNRPQSTVNRPQSAVGTHRGGVEQFLRPGSARPAVRGGDATHNIEYDQYGDQYGSGGAVRRDSSGSMRVTITQATVTNTNYQTKEKEMMRQPEGSPGSPGSIDTDGLFVSYRVASPQTVKDLMLDETVHDVPHDVPDAVDLLDCSEAVASTPHKYPRWKADFVDMTEFSAWAKQDVDVFLAKLRADILERRPEDLGEFVVGLLSGE